MHILHTEASCGWGGQELRILSEATGLQARGHRITLICPPEANICREAPKAGIQTVPLAIGRKRLPGLKVLRNWLRANPVDVINTHSSTDAWLAALACASLRGAPPIVRTRHISAPVPDNFTTRWLYTRGTRHVVTTGERLRQSLITDNGYGPDHITSVPTGIDPVRFSPGDQSEAREALGLDPNCRYIGIVATLRSWKGHHHLIEACTGLKGHDWRLLIIGDGPRRAYLEKMVAGLNLGDRVSLLGHRTDPERWLPALDLFCLPSYANEGVPQAILQAMLVGLPIISTDVGSITEAVVDGESGRIVPAQSVPDVTRALQELLDRPAEAARLGAAARVRALERFTRESMLDAMENIFETVAAGRPFR